MVFFFYEKKERVLIEQICRMETKLLPFECTSHERNGVLSFRTIFVDYVFVTRVFKTPGG